MRPLNQADKENILELYRCHYKPKEIAAMTGFSYATVITYVRAFKVANVKQYNREQLRRDYERAINE